MERTKTDNTRGLLLEVANNTSDSNILNMIIARLTSVEPKERSVDDFDILHAALAHPKIRHNTLKSAERMEKVHKPAERDIVALQLIASRLRVMLRQEQEMRILLPDSNTVLDKF
jgi:hypothetical protein